MNLEEYSEEKIGVSSTDSAVDDLRDVAVFEKVYDEYASRLLKHAFFRTGSEEEAQDIVAQVFFKTWQYLSNPKNEIRDVRAFLYQITHNLVVDYYRRRSKAKLVSFDALKPKIEDEKLIYPFGALEAKIDLEILWAQMQNLRTDYKVILVWRYVDELNIQEISKLIGKSKGATAVMLFRALKELRDFIKRDENTENN